MATYHEDLAKAGSLLDASGLQPSSKGWRASSTLEAKELTVRSKFANCSIWRISFPARRSSAFARWGWEKEVVRSQLVVYFGLRRTTMGCKRPISTFGGNYEIPLSWIL